jgi:hypothetical protein
MHKLKLKDMEAVMLARRQSGIHTQIHLESEAKSSHKAASLGPPTAGERCTNPPCSHVAQAKPFRVRARSTSEMRGCKAYCGLRPKEITVVYSARAKELRLSEREGEQC